mgnify:CR=1 FL=1
MLNKTMNWQLIEDELDDQEFKIAKIASDFLGKQLEA